MENEIKDEKLEFKYDENKNIVLITFNNPYWSWEIENRFKNNQYIDVIKFDIFKKDNK